MLDDQRFREVNDYAGVHGFAAGFPNFHQADYGDGIVYGTILLRGADVEWRDVPRSDYAVYQIEDVPAMFRAANDCAAQIGYPAAFPNFHQADHGQGVVYGTILIGQNVSEWRDVPRDEIGVYQIEDVGGMMQAANDYAATQGFAGAFPTFHQADHGQGVVYGIVLLKPGKAFWRDVHADLLALYSRPPTPWGIILCNLSDVAPLANARDRYVQYLTGAGAGTGGAFDYWRDMSYDTDGLRGAEIFGFFDIDHTRTELNAFAGQAQRRQIFSWGLAAARKNGVDPSRFTHNVVILNVSADHGAVGGGVVFGYEDARALEPTFFAHEMGHKLFDHSFGEQAAPCAPGDGRPGVYCDIYDIMSAMNVLSFQDDQNRRTGPSANAVSRERLGWLHRSRVWSPRRTEVSESVMLAAVNRPEVDGFLMAKFRAPGRADPQTDSTYTVELREAVGWDRGIGGTRVLIHEVRTDGLVRLLTNANGGVLGVGQEFATPAPTTVVRLEAIDAPTATAILRVWRLPASGRRSVRIVRVAYDPPGPDVDGEYLLLQNDTANPVALQDWTLRDLANHVYTFAAFTLDPGHSVRLWTKAGADGAENLYWGRKQAVWNNTGDTAILSDAGGVEVARYAYTA